MKIMYKANGRRIKKNINISKHNMDLGIGAKIALISDLHERNPDDAIDAIKRIQPDYIMFPGDLWERNTLNSRKGLNYSEMNHIQSGSIIQSILHHFTKIITGDIFNYKKKKYNNRTEEEKDYSNRFVREVTKIAPMILSVGNHEWYYYPEDYELLKNCGAVLLDNEDIFIDIKEKKVLIGGISTKVNEKWLKGFLDKDAEYKILMCHQPEYVERYIGEKGKVDLIVSGHTHGGQWRLFGVFPIYSSGQGFFPKYSRGLYETKAGKMIVTSGCVNPIWIPRIGNSCEVVEISL